jgi:hypothetical protein
MLIEWIIEQWCIKFLLINLKEVAQEAEQNIDSGIVCMVM